MASKRDSAYFERRLKKEFPRIFADLRSGRIKSVRQASIAAGLFKAPTRADALIREWKKATLGDRKVFRDWLASTRVGLVKKTALAVADADGRLVPPGTSFLRAYTLARKITPGRIMLDMGFKRYDWTLSSALNGGKLRPAAVEALKIWMPANGYK